MDWFLARRRRPAVDRLLDSMPLDAGEVAVKFGISMIVRGNDATPDTFVELGRRAEALGFDSLWSSAHVILPPQVKSGYVLIPGRKHPEHWKENYWEPFSVLSFLAAHTERLLLGTSVTVLPMHNPFEIAKQVAEVDNLSRGRFVFGIGVGWFEEEFEVLGQEFRNRGARTDDALGLMKALWTEEPVTYEGRFYRCADAHFGPKPCSSRTRPSGVAGASRPALRRVARYGTAFHPVRPSLDYLSRSKRELEEMLVEEGGRPTAPRSRSNSRSRFRMVRPGPISSPPRAASRISWPVCAVIAMPARATSCSTSCRASPGGAGHHGAVRGRGPAETLRPARARTSGRRRGQMPSSARATLNGIAKLTPSALITVRVLIPTTRPSASSSGPPLLPGLIGASVWSRVEPSISRVRRTHPS